MTPTQPSQAQITAGLMALLQCTQTELGDYSEKLMSGYEDDVRRVFVAMSNSALRAELTRPQQVTPSNSEAADARRELGKWLNEETNRPVDRVALAQLCTGFDALARPQEVAAVGDDVFWLYELTKGEGIYQGCKGKNAEHIMRQTVSGVEDAGEPFCVPTSRAPEVVRAEPVYLVATGVHHEGEETYTRHDVCPPMCDAEKLYTAPPSTAPAAEQGDKDAARYQWLREHSDSMSLNPPLTVAKVTGWGLEGWSGDDLNRAIDAAILASKPAVGEVGS